MSNLIEKKCKNCEEDAVALSETEIKLHLEELNQEQADYIGVKVEGPYIPEYYRY